MIRLLLRSVGVAPPPTNEVDAIAEAVETEGTDGWTWTIAALVIVGAVVVAYLARWLSARVMNRHLDPALAALISRVLSYVIVTVGLIWALDSVGVHVGPLLGALGIAGIALAFALRDILENFVAGILLQIRRPFTYGDEISIDDREGRVTDVDARLVTIETPNGETVFVPAATVVKSEVVNYTTRGARRTDVAVGVSYGTDLATACTVLEASVGGVDGVLDTPPPQALLTGFGDSSVDFVVRYWHEPSIASFWSVRHDVTAAVQRGLADAEIEIPFPQRMLWTGERPSVS